MTASEAREISKNAKLINMEFIYTEIKNAASTGKNSVFYYQSISELQMIELRENGFEVKNLTDHRDGVLYAIKW